MSDDDDKPSSDDFAKAPVTIRAPNDEDTQRGATDPVNEQSQFDNIALPTRQLRDLEVAFDVNENENTYWLSVISRAQLLKFFAVPVFTQSVEHVEIMWEVYKAGRIAMRKPNWNTAGESAFWWLKLITAHFGVLGDLLV